MLNGSEAPAFSRREKSNADASLALRVTVLADFFTRTLAIPEL
jgi:hypothetical protein